MVHEFTLGVTLKSFNLRLALGRILNLLEDCRNISKREDKRTLDLMKTA